MIFQSFSLDIVPNLEYMKNAEKITQFDEYKIVCLRQQGNSERDKIVAHLGMMSSVCVCKKSKADEQYLKIVFLRNRLIQ